jgi:hypothetical protein
MMADATGVSLSLRKFAVIWIPVVGDIFVNVGL